MAPIQTGVRRLFAVFIAALMALGLVILALPYFTLTEYEKSLRREYQDQAASLDYRLDHAEPLDRIFMENPAFVGYRQNDADRQGKFRYSQSRRPPALGERTPRCFRGPLCSMNGAHGQPP